MSADNEERILMKLDEITKSRYQNGMTVARIEERQKTTDKWIENHDKAHKSVNMKLWFLVLGIPIAIIIFLLKDSLFG